jgi:hypothetical protein
MRSYDVWGDDKGIRTIATGLQSILWLTPVMAANTVIEKKASFVKSHSSRECRRAVSRSYELYASPLSLGV